MSSERHKFEAFSLNYGPYMRDSIIIMKDESFSYGTYRSSSYGTFVSRKESSHVWKLHESRKLPWSENSLFL